MIDDYPERFLEPHMAYYCSTYLHSYRWQGEQLKDKRLIVYMEQGIGDQIMFVRFVRYLAERDPKQIIIASPKETERLFSNMGYDWIDKENPDLPPHDYHVCSLSLPFLLQKPIPLEPYIKIKERTKIPAGINVGIAWEGNPDHPKNCFRNCKLNYFRPLLDKDWNLYHLQPGIQDWTLVEGAEDMPLLGVEIKDWYDTAMLINALDYVVSVDTGVLHLAGAMGKPCCGLLGSGEIDPRWDTGMWYPTMRLVCGDWEQCMRTAIENKSRV